MDKATREEVLSVVGEEHLVEEWMQVGSVCYYKDLEPFGLIGNVEHNGIVYVCISTKQVNKEYCKMTREMLRDALLVYNTIENFALVFSMQSKSANDIKKLLLKRNGIISEYENISYIWYSRRKNI